MTNHEYRQWGMMPESSSNISIDRIVNKEQANYWEDKSARAGESYGNSSTVSLEHNFHSLPPISHLCVGCIQRSPHITVEEQNGSYLLSNNGLKDNIQYRDKVQNSLEMGTSRELSVFEQEVNRTLEEYSRSEEYSSSQGTSSLNDTTCSKVSLKSDENSKAKRQLAKKLWRQRDQMKKEEEKLIFQKKEQSFQEAIMEWVQTHADEWNEERIRLVAKELFQYETESNRIEGMEHMPVLQGSAFDLITKQRHRIQKRLPPGSLEQLPEEEVKRRRNEQKSASKWRAMQLQTEKMHLLRWNCRLLEELYKYMRRSSEVL
ncbi:hypothetical protein GpartN1_g7699.t1 [Galdieria partita]|uniref:Uncharacterized protein n=1 Tax=Galdieria partita TaxID=83374 RepID=A0A9C7UUQ0_9RHOD|nr:hypothetical protein GpartN1_g7699.t1 [Galdieria partita]